MGLVQKDLRYPAVDASCELHEHNRGELNIVSLMHTMLGSQEEALEAHARTLESAQDAAPRRVGGDAKDEQALGVGERIADTQT